MVRVKLPCVAGGGCDFQTVELEYEQSKELLDAHLRHAHPVAAGAGGGAGGHKKPEKFPRPELKLDASTEDWNEFKVTWSQYKAEYELGGAAQIGRAHV